MPNLRDYLTAPAVARTLGVHRKTINRAIREGRLNAERIGPFYFVHQKALAAYQRTYSGRPGRPKGRRDSYPRVRRTRAELDTL